MLINAVFFIHFQHKKKAVNAQNPINIPLLVHYQQYVDKPYSF